MEAGPMAQGPHPPRTTWWAAALGLTLLIGIMPQFLLGALGPQLRASLGIAASDVGLIFALLCGSAVLAAPGLGRVIDRTGGRAGAMALLGVTGAALLVASFAGSRAGLMLAFVPAGLAMAAANPATNRWAASAAAPRLQSLLVGVGQASVQVGALGAGLLAAAVAIGLDWRGALRVTAALALLGILVAARSPSDGPGSAVRRGAGTGGSAPTGQPPATVGSGPVARIRRRVQVALAAYALLMGGGTALMLTYLPTYAVDRVGLGVAAAGATAIVYGTVALATRLALSVTLRDPDRVLAAILVTLSLGAAVAVGLVAAAADRGATLLWAGTLLFGATGTAWPMVAFLGVVRASAPGTAGVVTGWVTAAFYTGLWTTPLVGGMLIAGPGYGSLWILAIACVLLAVIPAVRTSALAGLSGAAQSSGVRPADAASATATDASSSRP